MERWLWTQVSDMGPVGRIRPAMAYDEARDRVVVFGGRIQNPPPVTELKASDTWEWDGDSWTQVADSGPSGRSDSAMAYDARRKRVVLFGGWADTADLKDTWEWDGALWTQIEDSGPVTDRGYAMAFDRVNGYILLYINDGTWAWDGSLWTQLTEQSALGLNGMVAFDDAHGYVLLVAEAMSQGTAMAPSTTWRWDGSEWKQLSDMGPSCIVGNATLASNGERVALFVGNTRTTWEWNGTHWVQRQDIGPSPRVNPMMIGDTTRQQFMLFGGGDYSADTWAL